MLATVTGKIYVVAHVRGGSNGSSQPGDNLDWAGKLIMFGVGVGVAMRVDQLKAKSVTSHTVEMGMGIKGSVHTTPWTYTVCLLHRALGRQQAVP